MRIKLNLAKIACAVFATMSFTSNAAAPNPASQKWVERYAVPQLEAADWAAVCSSGTPTSQSGCFGNIFSAHFAKLNAGLQGVASYFNIPLSNVENSVFIQQYFGDSSIPTALTGSNALITNNSPNHAKCTMYTAQGIPLGGTGVNNCNKTPGNSSQNYYIYYAFIPSTAIDANLIYQECNSSNPSGDGYTPVINPVYMICFGLTNAGATASLQGISAS